MSEERIKLYAKQEKLVEGIVKAYRRDPVAVATAFDEVIDRSGALLGHLRDVAAALKGEGESR